MPCTGHRGGSRCRQWWRIQVDGHAIAFIEGLSLSWHPHMLRVCIRPARAKKEQGLTTEYSRYLRRLNDIVYTEVVPKLALFDFFTEHVYTRVSDPLSQEPLIGYIQSGLLSDVTFSLHRLIDTGGRQNKPRRNIPDFLRYTRDNIADITWKTPLTLTDLNRHHSALRAVESLTKRLRERRNNFFGHYDAEFFYEPDKLETEFPFSNEDAKSLVRTFQRILSDHNWAFSGTGTIGVEGFVYICRREAL
jgi:hypothetical protein